MNHHKKAVELLAKPCLTMDEKLYILEGYNEGATVLNGMTSAHFTPLTLAESFAVEVPAGPVLDLGVRDWNALLRMRRRKACKRRQHDPDRNPGL